MKITSMGIDLAKAVLQVHGVDAHGNVGLRKNGWTVDHPCGHRAVHAQGVETRKQGHSRRAPGLS